MITQMSNGWYLFDEHQVPRIIAALLVAGEQRLPHWFFVHGRNHITLQYSRRGMSILAPPDVWDAYADLVNLGDGEVIAARLDRLGWRRRPSYGFTGPGAAVTIMSSAIMGSELWLDIRGPKPALMRAAIDPLGVARLTNDPMPHAPATQPTVLDVTAHGLLRTFSYWTTLAKSFTSFLTDVLFLIYLLHGCARHSQMRSFIVGMMLSGVSNTRADATHAARSLGDRSAWRAAPAAC